MPRKMMSSSEAASKLINRATGAVEDFRQGVQRVTTSPTETAAKSLDKAKANYIKAIDNGKTAERLRSVSLESWQRRTLEKADRLATGVEASRDRIEEFYGQFFPHLQTVQNELAQMPTRTATEMEARMLHQMRRNRDFRFKPGRGGRSPV